jgi:hypothetical protein
MDVLVELERLGIAGSVLFYDAQDDDINEEAIERRLNWFENAVLPATEYFRKY